jgi:hypothetical protein
MLPKQTDKDTRNAAWTELECLEILNKLLEKKDSHKSGGRWKPTVWPDVVKAVQRIDPEAKPQKDQTKCVFKLNYVCVLGP